MEHKHSACASLPRQAPRQEGNWAFNHRLGLARGLVKVLTRDGQLDVLPLHAVQQYNQLTNFGNGALIYECPYERFSP